MNEHSLDGHCASALTAYPDGFDAGSSPRQSLMRPGRHWHRDGESPCTTSLCVVLTPNDVCCRKEVATLCKTTATPWRFAQRFAPANARSGKYRVEDSHAHAGHPLGFASGSDLQSRVIRCRDRSHSWPVSSHPHE